MNWNYPVLGVKVMLAFLYTKLKSFSFVYSLISCSNNTGPASYTNSRSMLRHLVFYKLPALCYYVLIGVLKCETAMMMSLNFNKVEIFSSLFGGNRDGHVLNFAAVWQVVNMLICNSAKIWHFACL